ncbi:MAG TPA: hypothetical protein PKC73_10155 [Dermatophilaceae bacterium]|jgi:toxin-antitoxin system PIN domain toxin|nr:VapC toxin family PIN domain ribonuclease [Actinomycetales bacterium]HMT31047.1 hypothetical protein [Dermatophilaceae bacterium]HMT89990.1 hypothetical protein [Dermatophilaceae bacterium]
MPESSGLLFDVNALVALTLTTHQHHQAAHRFLAQHNGPWATSPMTESALCRLLLNPVVAGVQRSFGEVVVIVKGFAQDPRWVFLADDSRLSDPSVDPRVIMGHSQVTDLHLLNLAVRHNMRLATFDGKLLSGVAPADRHRMVLIPS